MEEQISTYIKNKTFSFCPLQEEMEAYAEAHHVPIISRDSLDFLVMLLKLKKPKKILEIGTAIGYSSIVMASVLTDDAKITTLERDRARYDMAIENIKKAGLEDIIQVRYIDARESREILQGEKYDFVFIDAAKGQYQLFFDLIFDLVEDGGIIVSDNIFYKGMVCASDINDIDRRQRTIYKRMNQYLTFLKTKNDAHDTALVPIGDGLAITYKKGDFYNEES